MKHQRPLYSKYSCDDKLGIYSNPYLPKNNYEYRKILSNVKSKYMDDYNTSKKFSKYSEEKKFNNLLTNYYQDYNILKTKYNFTEEDNEEPNDYNITDEEYFNKRQNVEKIFSGDLYDIQDFNFEVTDNLLMELPKENNYSLIKNTQIKEDYDFRLQGFNKNNKYFVPNDEKIVDEENDNENEFDENNNNINININNINNNEYEDQDKVNIKAENNNINNNNNEIIIDNNNNISEENNNNINNNVSEEEKSIDYLDNDEQFNLKNNENYLILNQPNKNGDLPLFSDIISSDFYDNYRVPFYENPENIVAEEENVVKPKEEENSELDLKKTQKMEKYLIKTIPDDKNVIILENKNEENLKFEDIIDGNFQGNYIIPEYIIPNDIKKEMEEEQKKEEENKNIYNENAKVDYNNINNNNENAENDNMKSDNLPVMNDLIKSDNEENKVNNDNMEQNNDENKLQENNDNNKEQENNDNNMIEPEIKDAEKKEEKIVNKEPEKIEKERESYIDEDDQFEKIDVDGLENLDEDDDKKYDDFEA